MEGIYAFLNSKRTRAVTVQANSSLDIECLNCLVLIVASLSQRYDLYACIGYQSDSRRSLVKLLAGEGIHTITYSPEGTSSAAKGIFNVSNRSDVQATAYIIPLT